MPKTDEIRHRIADLYPDLTAAEQTEIEVTLRAYVNLVRAVSTRLDRKDQKFLTETRGRARLRGNGKRP
jgi:hypothetical protein